MPWSDFEWLCELLFWAAERAAGLGGIWALKVLLMGALLWLVRRLAAVVDGEPPVSAALLAAFGAGALAFSDARPELFSLIGLALLLVHLEARRLEDAPRRAAAVFVGFALWANAHAGFLLGWLALAAYAAESAARGRRGSVRRTAEEGLAAAAGTLLNPYGLGPHLVAFDHWRARADLARGIAEWRPMSFQNPLHWPFWVVLGVFAGALVLFVARRKLQDLPAAPVALAAYLGFGTLSHGRLFAFFNLAAVAALAALARERRANEERTARGCAGVLLVTAAYLIWALPLIDWRGPFNPKYVPVRAAEYVARESAVLSKLRVYNQWEWGGYLGWRVPDHRVYSDGRYVFHAQLPRMREAAAQAGTWQQFLKDERLDAALVPNLDQRLPTLKRYPDGREKPFLRPWYLFYMPREDWALVYWDEQALLFVRRAAVPKPWLAANELALVRPRDDEAFAEALARRELDEKRLAEERARHERDANLARRCRWLDACAWKPS